MKVIQFLIALVFFLGGMLLMGYSFELADGQAFMFFGGIVAIAIALFIPFHIIGTSERRDLGR